LEEVKMKITGVKGFPVHVGHRNIYIVKVDTDEGISGLGEGGMSGRELAMQGMLEHYAQGLIGMDPRRIEHIWQILYRSNYFEGGKVEAAVISAIDIALWDILGQHLGVPVYQLLGGAVRDRIRCFNTPGSLHSPACVEEARLHAERGWKYLRFGAGMPEEGWTGETGSIYEPMESIEAAVHWIKEVRNAVGPGVQLSIDFHHRLSVAEAAFFCQQVADVGLMFLEEPIRAENASAYAQLRSMTSMPFAIGEEFSSKWAFAPFLERGLINFARVDLSNVGGLTEARKVAAWCEALYIDMMPHNPLGPVTTAASIHFGAATSNFAQLEYFNWHASRFPPDLFPKMPAIDGDAFTLPTEPGLGVTFNEDAAPDHPFQHWEAPHWQRRDGAKTNW
jgi:galactonate dehydratase